MNYSFRRFLQKLPQHFDSMPKETPFQGLRMPSAPQIPRDVLDRWPEANARLLEATPAALNSLPIDHDVTLRGRTEEDLESARTHDELWNAAQRQLVREGRMHNYLRMLWGKKVLEWSDTPSEAASTLIHLNNKCAVDGLNPNSYSGIFWCFGRYDRPWGPERPIFGKVRYMSSENTRRKFSVTGYLEKYSEENVRSTRNCKTGR